MTTRCRIAHPHADEGCGGHETEDEVGRPRPHDAEHRHREAPVQAAALQRHRDEEAAQKEIDHRFAYGAVVTPTVATSSRGKSTMGRRAVAAIGMASVIHHVAMSTPTAAVPGRPSVQAAAASTCWRTEWGQREARHGRGSSKELPPVSADESTWVRGVVASKSTPHPWPCGGGASDSSGRVPYVAVDGMIALGLAPHLSRTLQEAERQ